MLSNRTDISRFIGGMDQYMAKVPPRIRGAIGKTCLDIMDDSLNKEPKPPIRSGDLRGSAAVVVSGGPEIQQGSGGYINPPSREGMPRFSGRVSFNTSYAERLETRDDWKAVPKSYAPGEESKVGAHWLSSKIKMFQEFYRQNFARYYRESA